MLGSKGCFLFDAWCMQWLPLLIYASSVKVYCCRCATDLALSERVVQLREGGATQLQMQLTQCELRT